jgi:hypothetical protein
MLLIIASPGCSATSPAVELRDAFEQDFADDLEAFSARPL